MPNNFDYETEIRDIVERYFEVADGIASAAASGCRLLQVDPFVTVNRKETDLRARLVGPLGRQV